MKQYRLTEREKDSFPSHCLYRKTGNPVSMYLQFNLKMPSYSLVFFREKTERNEKNRKLTKIEQCLQEIIENIC